MAKWVENTATNGINICMLLIKIWFGFVASIIKQHLAFYSVVHELQLSKPQNLLRGMW